MLIATVYCCDHDCDHEIEVRIEELELLDGLVCDCGFGLVLRSVAYERDR
jgi:hypothetical protein